MSEFGNATEALGHRPYVQETGYARKNWDRIGDSDSMLDRIAAAGTAGAILVEAELDVDSAA